MAFIDKSQQWRIKKEASYADANTTFDTADIVELINPTMDAQTDLVEREVLKNSLVKEKPIPGKETSSGSFGVEASSVVSDKLNGEVLYESGIGKKIAPTASESVTASSGTITVNDSSIYTVGQAMKFTGGAKTEFAVIRTIPDGTTVTVEPAPADDATTAEGLLSFVINKPDDTAISLAVEEYFENASNQITYTYKGVVVSDTTITYPLANIVKAEFNVAGAGFEVASNVGNRASTCHNFTPYIAKNMTFKYAGTSYDIKDLSVKITNDVYDVEALTTDGLTNKVITGKSEVGGSFSLEYEGTALFDAFKNGTSGILFGTVSNAGATQGIFAPKVIISKSTKSIDSSLYMDAADFVCLSSDTCNDAVEDALTVFFA